jgi:succinate-semialdehyde dehydrogenase/glutarate-semialdehyde dehydrogenase
MMRLNDANLLKNGCFAGGEWKQAESGDTFVVKNPANGEVLTSVPSFDAADTALTIELAERAWPEWRARTGKQRAALLRTWFQLILDHADDLALLMTLEQGKPLPEARGEVVYAASFVEWFAEEAKRVYGDVMPHPLPGKRIVVLKQGVGVCAAITPWNFPAAMITRKCAPALAAGCPVVVKPAEQTPLTALALAELAHRAGFPAGVFNVITGVPEVIGGELTGNPKVRKLSFTGSTEVGKKLMAQCAGTVKKISLELGGNAPFIVFDDADLDAAVQGAMASKYRNMGQTCVCANRIFVQDAIYDEFAARLSDAVAGLTVGNGLDEGVQQGPLIDEFAVRKVEAHIADAVARGGKVLTGGQRHELGGTFFQPTVLTNINSGMQLNREETFGPVAPLLRFQDEREALHIANSTRYGLAAYFYSRDISRVWRVAEGLEFGIVGINEGIISNEVAPFGGVKESGLGREGSRYGIEEYLEMKYLCLGGID